ncbi:MAG: succinyl-diaminopimelate desuccinylase [Alphaproteobacteria bacterium]|nr:succinyl-diaminopimelate desuccinylase [Alphaproteobacteria bacterium]
MTQQINTIELLQKLVQCPSVTPKDCGALDVLGDVLSSLGFTCHKLVFSDEGTPDVSNLYARLGTKSPNFCFAGHTDVVPVGDGWTVEPFAGEIKDGKIYGRGTEDMKGGVACFAAAVSAFLKEHKNFDGSISFLITGDEEGVAINGTKKVLEWLDEKDEKLDVCIVGEPSNPDFMGQEIKIGRRGSLNGSLTVYGTQGHVAKPHLADNPIPRLLNILSALDKKTLDNGTEHFQPSNLEITTIDVGNATENLIPAQASAKFNIRFCDVHTSETLKQLIKNIINKANNNQGKYDLELISSGDAFLSHVGAFHKIVSEAVNEIMGKPPQSDTSGGISDARFIKNYCKEVLEFGLVALTMHKADENVPLKDIENLTKIYKLILEKYFKEKK